MKSWSPIALAIASPYFLTSNNLFNVCVQIAVVAIIAVGQTMVILTAGIDLSVGSVAGLSGVATVEYQQDGGAWQVLFGTANFRGQQTVSAPGNHTVALRATDMVSEIPIALPLLEYNYIPEDKVFGGRFKADTSALYLARDVGTDMLRGSVDADWRRPFTTNDDQTDACW